MLKAGDYLLMVDSVYGPARALCDKTLTRFGIDVSYYDPLVGAGVADLMRPSTRLVYLESPGSRAKQPHALENCPCFALQYASYAARDRFRATQCRMAADCDDPASFLLDRSGRVRQEKPPSG